MARGATCQARNCRVMVSACVEVAAAWQWQQRAGWGRLRRQAVNEAGTGTLARS